MIELGKTGFGVWSTHSKKCKICEVFFTGFTHDVMYILGHDGMRIPNAALDIVVRWPKNQALLWEFRPGARAKRRIEAVRLRPAAAA